MWVFAACGTAPAAPCAVRLEDYAGLLPLDLVFVRKVLCIIINGNLHGSYCVIVRAERQTSVLPFTYNPCAALFAHTEHAFNYLALKACEEDGASQGPISAM